MALHSLPHGNRRSSLSDQQKMTFIKFDRSFFFSVLEFIFAGVAKLMEARRVPCRDSELTTVERGQNVEAGPSS